MANDSTQNLILVALTPSLLDKGLVWFEEHQNEIETSLRQGYDRTSSEPSATERCRSRSDWWSAHLQEFFVGQQIMLSQALRMLDDLHYEKVPRVYTPGQFAVRGGIIDVFPLNTKTAYRIEFEGNSIASIVSIPSIINTHPDVPLKKLLASKPSEELALQALQPEMFVVHIDHGIARFAGAKKSSAQGGPALGRQARGGTVPPQDETYLVLEYAANDRLLVPLSVAHKVTPYIGFGTPVVHRLGGNLWEKTKKKAHEDILKTAQEFARIYAKREIASRPPYEISGEMQESLAMRFAHPSASPKATAWRVETPDQRRAIAEVFADMENDKPMDRLICGDVGFGKTEIALRASACAVFSGSQVAVLAPTTVLAWQHFQTFKERFEPYPVRVAMLSRIESVASQKATLQECAAGSVDIVIGTHRLLSKDVSFAHLGLLVIDEEQRFGVKHKEHMKNLRAHVDVLSLSATPIPRTLSFSLAGLRDISLIETPPEGRLAIKTIVAPSDKKIVADAIEKEMHRHGQVYVLHNRVETITAAAKRVQDMFPQYVVAVAHAKLSEHELITTMEKFRNGKIDILVATTIIENGIDISSVNTLIVEDATRLGLSQAHQIRGRIGRSDVQAYAYLLYPQQKLGELAQKRLETLEAVQYLGAGYQIALRDLEMRGAGNFLGKDQSGTANKIGFNLYCQMMQDALEEIQYGARE